MEVAHQVECWIIGSIDSRIILIENEGDARHGVLALEACLAPVTVFPTQRFVVGTGVGSEMWRPMGIAVIGGLTMSTLMTLLFVPTMYTIFAYNGIKRTRKKMRETKEKQ